MHETALSYRWETNIELNNNLKEVRNYIKDYLKSIGIELEIRSYPVGSKYETCYYEYENYYEEELTLLLRL